jgi:hypothetical protein
LSLAHCVINALLYTFGSSISVNHNQHVLLVSFGVNYSRHREQNKRWDDKQVFLFHETWTRQTEIYICNIYLYFLYYFLIFSILCNIFRIELILILTMARNCLASHFAQHALKLGHKSHKNMCICCILLSTLQSCRIIPNPLVVQSF